MDIKSILNKHAKAVVIAHFKKDCIYNGGQAPQNPACLLQITLLSSKISNSGRYIRLGETNGDEIVGWTNMDTLEVVELLGDLAEDGKTVVPIEWPPSWSLEAQKKQGGE